ncbi:hypothetical protein B0T22DRAFT_453135 [Podospora appendiculata]|uniref:Uncharacterized protein n=1 Tax=Podospora appendiculata TaxID=314037 RepID=A0AAE0XJV9_9PEZI|nr:hypothetical protein B0T22DRAFT_453135 [Podospora appendiculata]
MDYQPSGWRGVPVFVRWNLWAQNISAPVFRSSEVARLSDGGAGVSPNKHLPFSALGRGPSGSLLPGLSKVPKVPYLCLLYRIPSNTLLSTGSIPCHALLLPPCCLALSIARRRWEDEARHCHARTPALLRLLPNESRHMGSRDFGAKSGSGHAWQETTGSPVGCTRSKHAGSETIDSKKGAFGFSLVLVILLYVSVQSQLDELWHQIEAFGSAVMLALLCSSYVAVRLTNPIRWRGSPRGPGASHSE